jgi:hypothetical protein
MPVIRALFPAIEERGFQNVYELRLGFVTKQALS